MKKFFPQQIRKNSFFFVSFFFLFFFLSTCIKVIEPRLESFYLAEIKVNSSVDVEALLVIKINNPNDFKVDVTIKNLRHYQDQELLGSLLKEKRILLKKQSSTTFNLQIVFNKSIFLSSLFSLLSNKDIEIRIQGEIVVHHWTGNHKIDLNKVFPINIKTLLGK